MEAYNILLVDNESDLLETFDLALQNEGFQVSTASGGEDALKHLSNNKFPVVITDVTMPGLDGLDVLRRAKELNGETIVIICTGNYEISFVIDALRFGADDYILKPCSLTEYVGRVKKCLVRIEQKKKKQRATRDYQTNEKILQLLKSTSHDIRGPLVSIAAGLKLLLRGAYGPIDEAIAQKLQVMLAKVMHVTLIAEDFLDKDLFQNGELTPEEEVINLNNDIIDPVLCEFASEIQERNIRILNCVYDTPENRITVKANRIWLRTVFRNLFTNAIKYGNKNCSITFSCKDLGSFYRLNVFNSGQPIPEIYNSKIFRKFERLPGGSSKDPDGTGLGLYLTKEIIKQHGGDMWYEAKNNGSNFVFTLPHS